MNVPFLDLRSEFLALKNDIFRNVEHVLETAHFILGEEVEEFEKRFAEFCESEHAVGVASGLDALRLSLRALDIGRGDEVITAADTFIATALAISSVGATPVLVDVDERSFNIDVPRIADAISPQTKAVIPVHLYGQPADMDPIVEIGRQHGIHVIEDASQAHGARYKGRRAGGLADIAAFSLYPGKNLGACGDAGIVVTGDAGLAERVATLRSYGSHEKYYHEMLGENSRLDSVQAAVLLAKLKGLEDRNEARRKIVARYAAGLAGVGDLVLPETMPYAEHVFHLYVVRSSRRDALRENLSACGVGCIIHYPVPIHLQKAYADRGWRRGDYPVTERISDTVLSLPIFPTMTGEQVDYVCDSIREFFDGR